MKSTVINTTLSLIALVTMALAANGARANDNDFERYQQHSSRYEQNWREQGHVSRQAQRASQQRLAEINQRQAQQHDRIQQGLNTHALTKREFRALITEQQRISSWGRDFTTDGFLSPFEFEKLDRALDIAGRNIKVEKQDRQTRGSGYGNQRYYN